MAEDDENNENLLPEVIIADILSRLPVKSLLRFRCVSKPWCALITDPAFVKMHLSQSLTSNCNISFISTSYNTFYYSVDLYDCEQKEAVELYHPGRSYIDLHCGTALVGSCNGLLCLSNDYEEMFIWNPSTRRHQKLPPSYDIEHEKILSRFNIDLFRFEDYCLGYDPTTDDYKLVMVLQYGTEDEYCCDSVVKVYSLSTNSWRNVGCIPFYLMELNGVLANSTIHWIAKRKTGPDTASSFILSFDLKDEQYRELSLPDYFLEDNNKFIMDVGVLGGQLCVLCNFFNVRLEVWIMKDYGVRDSWAKQFLIEQSLMLKSFEFVRPVCYTKNGGGEVILKIKPEGLLYSDMLLLYDLHTGMGRNLSILGAPDDCFQIETFVGSLVPLNAKDGTETRKKEQKKRKKKEQET